MLWHTSLQRLAFLEACAPQMRSMHANLCCCRPFCCPQPSPHLGLARMSKVPSGVSPPTPPTPSSRADYPLGERHMHLQLCNTMHTCTWHTMADMPILRAPSSWSADDVSAAATGWTSANINEPYSAPILPVTRRFARQPAGGRYCARLNPEGAAASLSNPW